MDIDQTLKDLQQAGLLDSHGEFSIDFVQAAKRMGRNLLPDPRMYVLRLYQSAVCSEGTEVEFRGNARNVETRIWGPPISLDGLRGLATRLTSPSSGEELAAHYLAVGVHAALACNPKSLQVITWDGREGASLRFEEGQESLKVLDRCPFQRGDPQTCLLLRRPWWHLRRPPEWEWLRRHCGMGPISLKLDGEQLRFCFAPAERKQKLWERGPTVTYSNLAVKADYHVIETRISGERDDQVEDLLVLPTWGNIKVVRVGSPLALRWGFGRTVTGEPLTAAIGIRADLRPRAQLRFVRHGVILDPLHFDVKYPGLNILASCAGLNTDLSGTALVQDDAFRARCSELLQMATDFWARLLEEDRYYSRKDPRQCVERLLTRKPWDD